MYQEAGERKINFLIQYHVVVFVGCFMQKSFSFCLMIQEGSMGPGMEERVAT